MDKSMKKLASAKVYIEAVITWWSIPQGFYGDFEDNRIKAHEKMIDQYDCNPMDLKPITENLDIWIGLPMERGEMPYISETQICQYAMKLHNILESKKFKEDGYCYVCDETKRLRKLWYDQSLY